MNWSLWLVYLVNEYTTHILLLAAALLQLEAFYISYRLDLRIYIYSPQHHRWVVLVEVLNVFLLVMDGKQRGMGGRSTYEQSLAISRRCCQQEKASWSHRLVAVESDNVVCSFIVKRRLWAISCSRPGCR